RCRVSRQEHVESLLATARRRKHVAKCDVRQQITVVVDIEPVDGIRMERVSIWICIEDDHGSRRVGGRQECVEIAQVESLVAKRRPEAQAGKVVRHCLLLLSGNCRSVWYEMCALPEGRPLLSLLARGAVPSRPLSTRLTPASHRPAACQPIKSLHHVIDDAQRTERT